MKIFIFFSAVLFASPLGLNAQYSAPETVLVKGGTFKMGNANGYSDESPQHSVTLSDFYIGKYEVTVAEYKTFCAVTGRKMPPNPPASWYEEHAEAVKWEWKNDYPMVDVTWYDAVAYCKWLSQVTGDSYSLPTEAQWEYAASGGSQSKHFIYSGSNNINEVAWYDETTDETGPRAVGQKKPNELGIYDMSGNAWEWCSDFYGKYTSASQKNPTGPSKGQFNVIRGGSWYYVEDMARLTSRDGPKPVFTNYNYGFRVVKSIK